MITSPDNEKLKTIRRLARRRDRDRTGLFVAEGEDLVAAAETGGAVAEFVLVSGEDVEPALLDAVSARLSSDTLTDLVGRLVSEGQDVATVARAFLTENDLL